MNPSLRETAPLEPLLNAREVALLLRVPLSWVYDNVALLPAFRIGRALRFRATEIEAWLEAQRDGVPSPPGEPAAGTRAHRQPTRPGLRLM